MNLTPEHGYSRMGGPVKPRRRDAAVSYLHKLWRGNWHIPIPRKQHFTVHQHNGTTVYETTDNRKAWEARYAKYVDVLNTVPDAPQARIVMPIASKSYRIRDMIDKGIL